MQAHVRHSSDWALAFSTARETVVGDTRRGCRPGLRWFCHRALGTSCVCGMRLTPFPHATQAPASAISFDELQGLTYLQVKGSGIANTCPVIDGGSSNLKDIKAGNYKINKLCLEPTSFTVKEESQFKGGDSDFVPTKLMTRLTYTLDEVRTLQQPSI